MNNPGRKLLVALGALVLLPLAVLAQSCENYHSEGDCRFDLRRDYKIYSQSHSVSMSPVDTVELNMVFYGQNDYILSFCTHRKMYPVHFILKDTHTGKVLYDNEEDDFIESLGLGFDVTKSIIIVVNVLARESSEEEIRGNVGCLGLLIQYKNYPKKKVKLQM
jgi:hypothetical protein